MKRKTLIAMLAALMSLALCVFGVACGISDEEESSVQPHTHVATLVAAKDANCTEAGNIAYYTCECGKLFTDEAATAETTAEAVTLAALGHDEVPHDAQEATCAHEGWGAYVTCSRCDYTTKEVIPASGEHTYGDWTIVIPQTCNNKGLREHTCSVCGNKEQEVTDALGHTYGNWTTTTVATCTVAGSKERVCSACNARETEKIPATGHTASAAVEENPVKATCTADGHYDSVVYCSVCHEEMSREQKTLAATGHTASAAVEKNRVEATCTADGHYDSVVYCSVCREEMSREQKTLVATGHTYGDWATTTAATCEAAGVETRTCACGDTQTREIEALGHDYQLVAGVTATYYEAGVAAHYTCKHEGCNDLFVLVDGAYQKTTAAELVLAKLSLVAGCEKTTEPSGLLHVELGAKLKGMSYGGVYLVDGKVAHYYHNEIATVDGETRFVTAGTNTQDKPYVFDQKAVRKYSFEYKIVNKCTKGVKDKPSVPYITQVLGNDGSYPIIDFEAEVDGKWHSYSYTLTDAQVAIFSGFIVKMGGLEGELLIANIEVEMAHTHEYTTWTTTTAATCEAAGVETRTCACGDTQTREIEALGHDYQLVAGVTATYYEAGVAAHYTCKHEGCNDLFALVDGAYTKTTAEALVLAKLSLVAGCEKTTEPENDVHLEIKKVKNMTYDGLYDVDGVASYYFYNEIVKDNGEIRFVTEGTDTTQKVNNSYIFAHQRVRSFSFEYKIVNLCEAGVKDKTTVQYITQIIGTDGSYDIIDFEPIQGDTWHSYSYTLTEEQIEKFSGFIVKMGGLNGQMLIANVQVDVISMIEGCETATEPEAVLKLEEGKTKKMIAGGVYNVDDRVAYYFKTGEVNGWGETRFVTDGTDTKTKINEKYIFAPQKITHFSFEYKIRNISRTIITDDDANAPYFSQIICSDSSYYPLELNMIGDGKWHTVSYDVPAAQQELFSGFIVKLGRLKGEMLIANIQAETVSMIEGCETATEPEAVLKLEEGKTKKMITGGVYNVDDRVAYYFKTGEVNGWGETRFVTDGTDTKTKINEKYIFAPQKITHFSFEYKIRNISRTIITDDDANAPYFSQIICSDSSYYPLELNMIGDGKWHTVSYDVPAAQQELFSGFIVKLGRLKGEMLIANIQAVHEHAYKWVTTTAATCEAAGEETGTCACGDTQTREIPASHDYQLVEEVPATYYETGIVAHYKCSRCNRLFEKADDVYNEITEAEIESDKLSIISNGVGAIEEPAGLLHIEAGKENNMTYGGLYNVDEKVAYYFYNDVAVEEKYAEARFITPGTNTTVAKENRIYNYHPEVLKFSFSYRFVNSCETLAPDNLLDNGGNKAPTIIQILEPEYAHNYVFNADKDGEWHTFEHVLTLEDRALFAGFIVKMGGLEGGLLIADIQVEKVDIEKKTLAEFKALSDSKTYYQVSGYVSLIEDNTSGKLYLFDGEESLYVYGLCAERMELNDKDSFVNAKNFSDLGVRAGDYITIEGTKTTYSGKVEAVGSALMGRRTATDAEKAYYEVQSITIKGSVSENFELNQNATWTSNNDAIVIDGTTAKVTRGDEDVVVTLTATVTVGEKEASKEFAVIVVSKANTFYTATMYYEGLTTNMVATQNNAATVNLNPNIFTITSTKNSGSVQVGLNKNGSICLYKKEATTLTISIAKEYTIKSIEVNYSGGTLKVTKDGIGLNIEDGIYIVNGGEVKLMNTNTSARLDINSIIICYA